MLDEVEVRQLIADMWRIHLAELSWLDRIYGYSKGLRGGPEVPDNASQEVRDLAKLSIKNVLGLVRDSFAQNLSVTGYRTAMAEDNDPAWRMWQRNRMDARQAEVHRFALTYGAAYLTVSPGVDGPQFRPRSPKRMLAVYDDPVMDEWPQYALEIWVTERDAKRHRRGRIYDSTHIYELDLGWLTPQAQAVEQSATVPVNMVAIESVVAHGATYGGRPVCPVVRFVNARDGDDQIVGEVAPLILLQQAINNVNFDRLLVSRFGAFPQKVITGWKGTTDEMVKTSASRLWAFDDPDVKASALPAAAVDGYNSILEEMLQHVAMVAQISPAYVTGKMVNLSAEALAAAEANEQRKLTAKRESFGESWEQALRLAAEMDGDAATAADSGAEVVWRDTEARAFSAVVDGVTKLAACGVPVEDLLDLVPNMTQQKIQAIATKIRMGQMGSLIDKLTAAPAVGVRPPDGAAESALSEFGDESDDDESDDDAPRGSRVSAPAGAAVG